MPNTQSAKKALRQNLKRRALNRTQRSALKTVLKKVRTAAATGSDAKTQLSLAYKSLDQAAAKRLIHPNKAARLKSRLTLLYRKAESKPAAPAANS
ncbi:MAG: 30S ribosomal protein S20 [Planctomycetaceae bacterium]|nr:30S ribosomal protein S20 [Planctomycetaceae bacterium]